MDNPMKQRLPLTRIAALLSLWTLAAYHIPCFRLVTETIEKADFNGVMIFAGLVILMLALNFLVYYLVLFLGRTAGKVLLALTLVGDAVALYFINTYQVLINDQMMGNVLTPATPRPRDSSRAQRSPTSCCWASCPPSSSCSAGWITAPGGDSGPAPAVRWPSR